MIVIQLAFAGLLMTVAPQPADIASVQGSVRDAGSGRPLIGATVELQRIGTPANVYSYVVLTSGNGTFEVPQVTPGDYRLTAKLAGYFSLEYGQHTSAGSGLPLHFGAGDSKRNIRISLTRAGVISGRILTTDGDPATTAIVQAIEVTHRAGQPVYTVSQMTIANDLGEYRLFELHPGRYIVSVTEQGNLRSLNLANLAIDTSFANVSFLTISGPTLSMISRAGAQSSPIFYPGTADAREASAILVSPGAVLNGVNMTVSPVTSHHIRGIATGNNVHVQVLSLTPVPGTSSTSRDVSVTNGTFDIPNVSPGRYLLRAQTVNAQATLAIEVRDLDVNDVFLEPRPGIVIPTRVQVVGLTGSLQQNDYQFIRFRLVSDPPIPGSNGAIYSTLPDGSVNFDLADGQDGRIELFSVNEAPQALRDAYIQSIRLGTQDALKNGLKYSADASTTMEIVIGTRPGVLSGVVLEDDAITPSINTIVVLVPDAERRLRSDAYRSARTDEAGQFQISRIPPGEYKAFAWNDVDDGDWLDPDFLDKYEAKGVPVHVEELSRANLKIQALP